MTLPFLKVPLTTTNCLIGVGSVGGLSAVSYGGYYIYDSSLPSYGDKLTRNNQYSKDIPSASSLKPTKIDTNAKWKIDRFQCFDKFFPGVVHTTTETAEEGSRTTFNDLLTATTQSQGTVTVGCMMAKMDFTSSDQFTYTSEVTFKNDNFGGAIGSHHYRHGVPQKTIKRPSTMNGGTTCVDDYDHTTWSHHILFLEKTDDSGKIKGGYFISESKYFPTPTEVNQKSELVTIELPGSRMWTNGTSKTTRTYSGIGTTDDAGSSVLEGIKFKYDNNAHSFFGNPSLLDSENLNLLLIGFYNVSDSKGKTIKTGQSATGLDSSIKTMYEPFKDKKGKGHEAYRYCSSLSSRKHLSTEEEERLKLFCYKKKSS